MINDVSSNTYGTFDLSSPSSMYWILFIIHLLDDYMKLKYNNEVLKYFYDKSNIHSYNTKQTLSAWLSLDRCSSYAAFNDRVMAGSAASWLGSAPSIYFSEHYSPL